MGEQGMSRLSMSAASDEEVAKMLRDCLDDVAEMINILEKRGWIVDPTMGRVLIEQGRAGRKMVATARIHRNQSL